MKNKIVYVVMDASGDILGIYSNKEKALNHAWKEFCSEHKDETEEEIKIWLYYEGDEGKTIKEVFWENMGTRYDAFVIEWELND